MTLVNNMKFVIVAVGVGIVGGFLGYVARMVITEDRVQTNLSRLSGESLVRLDQLSAITEGFSATNVDALWTEWKKMQREYPAPELFEEAARADQAAFIYRQVELVGWSEYRQLIQSNSQRFLGWRPTIEKLGHGFESPKLLDRIKAAEAQIVETFPDLNEKLVVQPPAPTAAASALIKK